MATSLRPSKWAMSSSDSLTPKTHSQNQILCCFSTVSMKFGIMTHLDSLNLLAMDKNLIFWKPRWQTASARTCLQSTYSKRLSRGQNWYGADVDGVPVGATWQIRLNHQCHGSDASCVKFLWVLVFLVLFQCIGISCISTGLLYGACSNSVALYIPVQLLFYGRPMK